MNRTNDPDAGVGTRQPASKSDLHNVLDFDLKVTNDRVMGPFETTSIQD